MRTNIIDINLKISLYPLNFRYNFKLIVTLNKNI